MHVISSPCVRIFHPSELHSCGCVLVRHGLCTFAFLNLCARDDVHSVCQSAEMCLCSCLGSAVAQGLTERVRGTSAFLFGWADFPLQRGLAHRRKEMGWFKKMPDLRAIRADVGPQPQKRFGLTGEPEVAGNEG